MCRATKLCVVSVWGLTANCGLSAGMAPSITDWESLFLIQWVRRAQYPGKVGISKHIFKKT